MPAQEKIVKPTDQEQADEQLTKSINNWTKSVFKAAKTIGKDGKSNLQRYVGPAYDVETMRSVPFMGPLADKMAKEKYQTRKNGGSAVGWETWGDKGKPTKVSMEEQQVIEQMEELQADKVFQKARSTYTDNQLERVKSYTPNPTNDDNTILNYAITYKMQNDLARFVRRNKSVQATVNQLVDQQYKKHMDSGMLTKFSPDMEKRNVENQLIDLIDNIEYKNYSQFLKSKLKGKNADPEDLKDSDFSPAIYGLDTINNFFREKFRNPDLDLSRGPNFIDTDVINDDELPGALKSYKDRPKVAAERQLHNKAKYNEWKTRNGVK